MEFQNIVAMTPDGHMVPTDKPALGRNQLDLDVMRNLGFSGACCR
jgi:hypothetical protein